MKKWLIRKLGGYTREEVEIALTEGANEISAILVNSGVFLYVDADGSIKATMVPGLGEVEHGHLN